MTIAEQVDLLSYDNIWEFPKGKLKFGRTLGQGAFGRVFEAEAFGLKEHELSTTVAVKMLKEGADISQQRALLAELKILIHLGSHVNIVNLMGAVTKNIKKGELLVIMEYCKYGNLRNYLLRHRGKFVNEVNFYNRNPISSSENSPCDSGIACDVEYRHNSGISMSCSSISNSEYNCRVDSQEHVITTSNLLCFAFQSARGMEYLASRKLVHRDLAARNVLLAEDKVVKICDFGLAKDCYKYGKYVKKGDGLMPIKWMAIESLRDNVYTTKSDVWSFGILIWEIFTLGGNPYPGIEIDEEFYHRLKNGFRMEKPDYCPDAVYHIMQDCWFASPDYRPDFSQIVDILGGLLETKVKQHYIDLNAPYLKMNNQMPSQDCLHLPTDEYQIPLAGLKTNSDSSKFFMCDNLPHINQPGLDASFYDGISESLSMIQLEIDEDK